MGGLCKTSFLRTGESDSLYRPVYAPGCHQQPAYHLCQKWDGDLYLSAQSKGFPTARGGFREVARIRVYQKVLRAHSSGSLPQDPVFRIHGQRMSYEEPANRFAFDYRTEHFHRIG